MASPLDNKDPEWVRLDKLELYKTRLAKIKACTVPAVLASLLTAKRRKKIDVFLSAVLVAAPAAAGLSALFLVSPGRHTAHQGPARLFHSSGAGSKRCPRPTPPG